jgi:hypothetical protein
MEQALGQFMANIEATQARDHADIDFITRYQKLADRCVAAELRARDKDTIAPISATEPVHALPERTTTPVGFFYRAPASPKVASSPTPAEPVGASTLRQQLAEAQRARTTLEKANAQIPTLQASSNAQARQITVLEKELAAAKRRLRDREEEIKEKQKLASDVQDEMVSLNLQLSVAEQKAEKLEKENKTLVERWMREMEGRADRMNRDMGFGGASRSNG